jgi:hypothetical protein
MKHRIATLTCCVSLLATPLSMANAQTRKITSPPHTVALLELFTSEGCSSCPPADRFISALHQSGLSPQQVVPLSLHVDYWDYIGWKDMYAKRLFTERQRWLSDLANTRTIYTPEFFVSGKEVRSWRSGDSLSAAVARVNAKPAQADITVTWGKPERLDLPLEVSVKAPRNSKLFIALYENRLSSSVKSGENQGVELRHDYVVRDWLGPVAVTQDKEAGKLALPRALAIPAGAAIGNLGVAAFVQTDNGEVLQALSAPL